MRLLFISETDECRGPMAQAIAERLARKADVEGCVFDSAGLTAKPGTPAEATTQAFLLGEKIHVKNHRAKNLTNQIVDSADVILCMTEDLTRRTRKEVGADYEEKVVLLNEAIMLSTTRMDIERPSPENLPGYRRLFASLLASLGRLVRTLEDPDVSPEFFGAKPIPKKFKPGMAEEAPEVGGAQIDPEKRLFLTNLVFHLIEWSFEPPTTGAIQQALAERGHEHAMMEVKEILEQDLHGFLRCDKDGVWHVIPGAAQKRQAKARQSAHERAEEERRKQREEKKRLNNEKMTEPLAFEILGLPETATFPEVQQRYKQLLKRYHPDRFHDDDEFRELAEDKAQRINEAWDYLEDRLPR